MRCSFCLGMLAYLGTLGTLAWFRCTACGMEHSASHADVADELPSSDD